MQPTILSLNNISFTYPGDQEPVLKEISLSLREGEITLLCGASGCGKSTLLAHMKKDQIPFGSGSGDILFDGEDLEAMSDLDSARCIGYVGQDPDSGIVTDRVWHELAFGLENLGLPTDEIRQRIAEISEYCGITSWFDREICQLSGGQKQILNLASVLVMHPRLLILDEPTSQMDPIGVRRFVDLLCRLNQELGITMIICEQHLEEVLPIADQLLIMDQGRLLSYGPASLAHKVVAKARERAGTNLAIESALPVTLQVYLDHSFCAPPLSPWSIRAGREFLRQHKTTGSGKESPVSPSTNGPSSDTVTVLEARDLCFSYVRGNPILDHFSLKLQRGECFGLLGGNGSGKSTALKVIGNILKTQKGRVKSQRKMLYLSQDPKDLFTEVTVEEELADAFWGQKISEEEVTKRVSAMLDQMKLREIRGKNPMDLSGGQQQRLALGKLLLLQPDILLLDEPTKGMDALFKEELYLILKELLDGGLTILLVSHDLEFSAKICQRVGLLFQGQITSEGSVREFFTGNAFYTTAARRMTRNILPDCILPEDITRRLGQEDFYA